MIDLTHCQDFVLGTITVRPSSRELVTGNGTVMIEPKMMRMLVTLAGASGQVVSRDELVEECWNGRIVGDDAINRIIGKLRRLAEGPAADSFSIETVARAGHRLIEAIISPVVGPADTARPRPARWLFLLIPFITASLLFLARGKQKTPARPIIMVHAF